MNSEIKHLAIILDGNRRFAKKLMLKPWKGHEWGAKKIEHLLEWCLELGIKELTLYAFSTENFNRPKKEFDYLMELFKKEFERFKNDERIEKYDIKINIIGRIQMFPEEVQKEMKEIMEKTKHHKKFIINFAMAYGGRYEIVDAAKKLVKDLEAGKLKPEEIDDKKFAEYLYMKDEPDLIIRTGGEQRTSNFLLWQSSYSEWFFLTKFWPEFEKEDLINCIEEFKQRGRRFGR